MTKCFQFCFNFAFGFNLRLYSKVWQYVNLTKRIFLIDCPGVVYHGGGGAG